MKNLWYLGGTSLINWKLTVWDFPRTLLGEIFFGTLNHVQFVGQYKKNHICWQLFCTLVFVFNSFISHSITLEFGFKRIKSLKPFLNFSNGQNWQMLYRKSDGSLSLHTPRIFFSSFHLFSLLFSIFCGYCLRLQCIYLECTGSNTTLYKSWGAN